MNTNPRSPEEQDTFREFALGGTIIGVIALILVAGLPFACGVGEATYRAGYNWASEVLR